MIIKEDDKISIGDCDTKKIEEEKTIEMETDIDHKKERINLKMIKSNFG